LLKRSCAELEQALIAVTHDARAASYADRVVFLRDGKIVKQVRFDREQDTTERLHTVIQVIEALDVES
ncbi:MAG: hypothetical protein PVJ75_11580, partial [Chloroflexota bacterium]